MLNHERALAEAEDVLRTSLDRLRHSDSKEELLDIIKIEARRAIAQYLSPQELEDFIRDRIDAGNTAFSNGIVTRRQELRVAIDQANQLTRVADNTLRFETLRKISTLIAADFEQERPGAFPKSLLEGVEAST